MKESQLISLQNEKVSELNHEVDCPNLTYFSVGLKDNSSLKISNNFFERMQRLKVLEFAKVCFTSLPSSLDSLKALCTLRLIGCDLEDIVILGELGKLEILDLRRSRIKMLPKEIGQLTKLKLLDLSDCYNLEVISPSVLSKLSKLGELYLYGSFDGWEADGIDNPRSNASLVELQHLSLLTTLEVHIPHVEAIPNDSLFLGRMERYKISIGGEKWGSHIDRRMETSRMLKLKTNKNICLVHGIKLLLRKTQNLYLDGVEDVGEMQMLGHPNVESFGKLRFIKVSNCNMLQILFSSSVVKRLCQLEELDVFKCENITGLVVEKGEIDESDILEFNKLSILKLDQLDRFSGLWYSKNTLQSFTCLFDKKVSCPALKKLELNRCHKLKYVFSSSLAKSFVHLKTLEVCNCHEMEGVIEGTLAAEEAVSSSIRLFPKLVSMKLRRLPKLRRFCCEIIPIEFSSLRFLEIGECHALNTFTFDDGKSRVTPPYYFFNERVILPVLEQLVIECMENLKRLWADQLVEHSFSKLTSIELSDCSKLLNVFPLSMLTRLQRLKRLEICNCESVEEIICEGGNSGMPSVSPQFIQSFEFPNLTSLSLYDLPNLKSIHHKKMLAINWPSLKKMTVKRCEKVEIVFSNSQETSSQQSLFWMNEVSFPALKELKVMNCRKLKYVFTSSMVKSFVQLKTLEVSKCDEMEGVIQGILAATKEEEISGNTRVFPELDTLRLYELPQLKRFCCEINLIEFPSIRSLRIVRCPYLNTFAFDDGKSRVMPTHYLFNEKVILPALEKLEIRGMDNLERLWTDQLVEHSFSKLTSIDLVDCPKLMNVFPLSMLTRLERLKRMWISSCESVEEIIYEGGNSSSGRSPLSPQFIQSFEFSNLTSLDLIGLPNLKRIHHNKMHTINWPSLKRMEVKECEKVEILFANSQETSSQQPLFWVNQSTFPNLHQINLEWNAGIKHIIWHGEGQQQQQQHFVSQYFPNLKVVGLFEYPDQVTVLPSYLLSLPNLQTFEIRDSCFKEMIFQSEEGGEEKPASLLLSHITQLCLVDLPELVHLWKEKEGFPNLRILQVSGCSKLKANLVPSSVSFRNLVTLEVEGCHGIIKLITHSTAKSLVQLKQMSIHYCENIEEIIQGGDDDDDDDEIGFPLLNRLELGSLPKLESFCSSDKYTFGFPSLQFLLVHNCPKMKMFSQEGKKISRRKRERKKKMNEKRNPAKKETW